MKLHSFGLLFGGVIAAVFSYYGLGLNPFPGLILVSIFAVIVFFINGQ